MCIQNRLLHDRILQETSSTASLRWQQFAIAKRDFVAFSPVFCSCQHQWPPTELVNDRTKNIIMMWLFKFSERFFFCNRMAIVARGMDRSCCSSYLNPKQLLLFSWWLVIASLFVFACSIASSCFLFPIRMHISHFLDRRTTVCLPTRSHWWKVALERMNNIQGRKIERFLSQLFPFKCSVSFFFFLQILSFLYFVGGCKFLYLLKLLDLSLK